VDVGGHAKLLQPVLGIVGGGKCAATVGAAQPITVEIIGIAGGKDIILPYFGEIASEIVGVRERMRDAADGFALRGYPETWLGKKADLLDS